MPIYANAVSYDSESVAIVEGVDTCWHRSEVSKELVCAWCVHELGSVVAHIGETSTDISKI